MGLLDVEDGERSRVVVLCRSAGRLDPLEPDPTPRRAGHLVHLTKSPWTMLMPRVKRSRACAVSMDNQYTDYNLSWSCGTKILSMSNPAVYCTRLSYIRSYSYHAYNAMHNFVIT